MAKAPTSQEQPEDLIAQFQRGLAAVLRQQGGSLTLRLEPQSLGELRVRMDLAAGKVEATLEASTNEARRLLDESLGSLRSALEAQGLEIHRLDVRPLETSSEAHGGGGLDDAGGGAERRQGDPGAERPGSHGPGRGPAWAEPPSDLKVMPDGLGIGAGGALVRLRLDTVG